MPFSSTSSRGRHFFFGLGAFTLLLGFPGFVPLLIAAQLAPGPWGIVQVSDLPLVPPEPVVQRLQAPRADTWEFVVPDVAAVDRILTESGLPEELRAPLIATGRFDPTQPGRWSVMPPAALRWSLSREQRRLLYHQLARFSGNTAFILPGVLPDAPVMWAAANLNPDLRLAIERLTFIRRGMRCLADGDLLAAFVRDNAEQRRLLRLLTTTPALRLELTRANLANRAAFNAYWQLPDNRQIEAALARLERDPAIASIDVAELLPPRARALLNAYPPKRPDGLLYNCFWTALNFNRLISDDRLLARGTATDTCDQLAADLLTRDYDPVFPPYRFGDVLALQLEFGDRALLEHTMIYVADDVVLTKNGYTVAQPYVFMRLAQLDRAYPFPRPLQLVGYRRRTATGRTAP